MQTFAKKRIEIIVEAPILKRVLDLLDRLQVSGYTVFDAIAGRGNDGSWRREGQVTMAGSVVMVLVITSDERVQTILEPVYEVLSRQIGIVTVSDCQVVRAEHFK